MRQEGEIDAVLVVQVACVGEVGGCIGRIARETTIILDPDRDFGVTQGCGYMGGGGLVDLDGLVGGGVIGGAGGHAEEILVCHALGKMRAGESWTVMGLSWL